MVSFVPKRNFPPPLWTESLQFNSESHLPRIWLIFPSSRRNRSLTTKLILSKKRDLKLRDLHLSNQWSCCFGMGFWEGAKHFGWRWQTSCSLHHGRLAGTFHPFFWGTFRQQILTLEVVEKHFMIHKYFSSRKMDEWNIRRPCPFFFTLDSAFRRFFLLGWLLSFLEMWWEKASWMCRRQSTWSKWLWNSRWTKSRRSRVIHLKVLDFWWI